MERSTGGCSRTYRRRRARRVAASGRSADAHRSGGHGQEGRVIAVTKTHGPEAVAAAWRAGLEDVGENRVQEALGKMAAGSPPVRWHLIGHLQRNKVKSVDAFFLVHSIDSLRLATAANAHATP